MVHNRTKVQKEASSFPKTSNICHKPKLLGFNFEATYDGQRLLSDQRSMAVSSLQMLDTAVQWCFTLHMLPRAATPPHQQSPDKLITSVHSNSHLTKLAPKRREPRESSPSQNDDVLRRATLELPVTQNTTHHKNLNLPQSRRRETLIGKPLAGTRPIRCTHAVSTSASKS